VALAGEITRRAEDEGANLVAIEADDAAEAAQRIKSGIPIRTKTQPHGSNAVGMPGLDAIRADSPADAIEIPGTRLRADAGRAPGVVDLVEDVTDQDEPSLRRRAVRIERGHPERATRRVRGEGQTDPGARGHGEGRRGDPRRDVRGAFESSRIDFRKSIW